MQLAEQRHVPLYYQFIPLFILTMLGPIIHSIYFHTNPNLVKGFHKFYHIAPTPKSIAPQMLKIQYATFISLSE